MKKIKRILSIIICSAVAMTLAPAAGIYAQPLEQLDEDQDATTNFSGGSGTEEDPYIISSINGVIDIKYNLTKSFKLECDIILPGSIDNCLRIGSIGQADEEPFTGTFDGDGHKITCLSAEGVDEYNGIFGCVDGGVIKNLELAECKTYYGGATGVLVGCLRGGGEISNCTVTDSRIEMQTTELKGTVEVGIICGRNEGGTIKNCTSNTDLEIPDNENIDGSLAGGICGSSKGGLISNCTYTGNISTPVQVIECGGVTGEASDGATIEKCCNTGDISTSQSDGNSNGKGDAGGIAGYLDRSTIVNCNNSGNISSDFYCNGGIAGYVEGGNIASCCNSGDIGNGEETGGIAGVVIRDRNEGNANITNCYNIGTLYPVLYDGITPAVGGIVGGTEGLDAGSIANCYNIGQVVRNPGSTDYNAEECRVGGAVGWGVSGVVSNVYYLPDWNTTGGTDSQIGTACELVDMLNSDTYGGFDFTDVWQYGNDEFIFPKLAEVAGSQELSIESVEMRLEPYKKEYFVNEPVDLKWMTIHVILSNGRDILCKDGVGAKVLDFASDTVGKKTVKFSFLGREFTYDILVKEETRILPFKDVADTAWYADAVRFAYNNNVIKGYNDSYFGPNDKLSRAQFATIIYRLNGPEEIAYTGRFSDVPNGKWYTVPVEWVADNKVVTGYKNGRFGPNDNITREQIATILYRFSSDYLGEDVSNKADLASFKDADKVSSFAVDAMKWCVAENIITGKDNGTRLDPKGNATRAECAAIMQRYMD